MLSTFKEMITALQESEKKYRILIEQASDGIFIFDHQGNIIDVNSMACQMLEFTREEFLRQSMRDLIPADEYDAANSHFSELLAGKAVISEKRMLRKDGTLISVEMSTKMLEDGRLQTIVRDITDRKRTEEALRKSEARFRAIFETAQDSIFIKDRALRYVHVNPAMEKLFGLPFSKLIKRTDEDLFGEEAGKHIVEIDSQVLSGEIIEEEHTKPVKEVLITFHVIKVPIRDSSGEIIGLCGIARDITERKEAEKALQDSKAKYAAIVEGFDGFIYICAENYDIEFMNERLIERTGYNAIGQRCYKTLHGLDEICQWCENEKIIRGEVVRREIRDSKDNRWYYIVNTPIHNQNGSISRMTMIQDITEKKENEIRLIMTERLAALGQMAFGIAHEINNPLATIAACAEGLLNRLKKGRYNPELFEGYLRIMDEEVIRCKGITTSMLSFVRKTTYEKKYINEALAKV